MIDDGGWTGFTWYTWDDLGKVRERLAAGADPNRFGRSESPLHIAAENGSADVVAELARQVDDVDAMVDGRSALWQAVAANRPDNARALVAAGADPWRDMMSGWSPGRLSLASPTPDLFDSGASLTTEEAAAVEESRRLIAVLGDIHIDGLGLACVAGVDVAEAMRRLDAEFAEGDPEQLMAEWEEAPFDGDLLTMWATDVPGGCVLAQPWGYGPQMPVITKALSAGTTCYGMYANPKSGNQGSIMRDGEVVGWDLHPGGGPYGQEENVLLSYLYVGHAVAFCFAYAGLRPADTRAVTGPPDAHICLPERDYWH